MQELQEGTARSHWQQDSGKSASRVKVIPDIKCDATNVGHLWLTYTETSLATAQTGGTRSPSKWHGWASKVGRYIGVTRFTVTGVESLKMECTVVMCHATGMRKPGLCKCGCESGQCLQEASEVVNTTMAEIYLRTSSASLWRPTYILHWETAVPQFDPRLF